MVFSPFPPPPAARTPRERIARIARVFVLTVAVLIVLPYLLTPLYLVLRPVSMPMLWRYVTFQRVERDYLPLAKMSPVLPLTVIAAEDARFCSHSGIDWQGIREAIEDAEDLEDLRGGSTITQQVAKNLFLWQGRSFLRKALEFPLSIWIDLILPKRRIVEIYLNIAEWGPDGEFGAEAGARRAFNRSAANVSAQEAALLSATLPNPIVRNARQPGPSLRRIAGIHMRRAASSGPLDACIRH